MRSKHLRAIGAGSTASVSMTSGGSASAGSTGMPGRLKLSTTTRRLTAMAKKLTPIPPGEILLEEFMQPLGVSRNRLARDIDIPVSRVSDIVRGKRSVTADTALRLAEYFGTSPELWLNLQ